MHCLHFMQCPLVANWKEQWFINGPLIQNTFAKILGRICYPYVEHSINLLNIGLIRIIPTRTLILILGAFLPVDLGRVRREPFSRNPKPPRRRRHGRHRRIHLARRVRVRNVGVEFGRRVALVASLEKSSNGHGHRSAKGHWFQVKTILDGLTKLTKHRALYIQRDSLQYLIPSIQAVLPS